MLMGSFLPSEYLRFDRQAVCVKSMHSATFKTTHWWELERQTKTENQAVLEVFLNSELRSRKL